MRARGDHESWTCRTVMADGSDEVHLTLTAGTGSAFPDTTLCDAPVAATPPSGRFQDRGCRQCAEASLEHGILGARDRGATINLQRFYARTGGGGAARSRPLPFQLPPPA